jgi:uridine phosphorylase
MSVPQYPEKWTHRSAIEPDDFCAYARERGTAPRHRLPETMFIVFSGALFTEFRHFQEADWTDVAANMTVLGQPAFACVGVACSTVGAPAAAALMEELLAYGAKRIITVRSAGALSELFAIGDGFVCGQAVRDEGVSQHYMRPEFWARPDRELSQWIASALNRASLTPTRLVSSWTTDAPYRETDREIGFYRSLGVETVEMEAAALMSVAEYRQVPFASVFVISDHVTPSDHWQPQFFHPDVVQKKKDILHSLIRNFA